MERVHRVHHATCELPQSMKRLTKSRLINRKTSPISYCSDGWSEQEEEDLQLDEAVSDEEGDTTEESEDELTKLQKEMDMDLEELMEK